MRTNQLKFEYNSTTEERIDKKRYEGKLRSSNGDMCPIVKWSLGLSKGGTFGSNIAKDLVKFTDGNITIDWQGLHDLKTDMRINYFIIKAETSYGATNYAKVDLIWKENEVGSTWFQFNNTIQTYEA